MPQILHPPTALPGIPLESSFQVLDESGASCGHAAVVEYINQSILPERPLNYYLSINALTERAFDMLMGATLARSMALRQNNPNLRARIYAPCKPHDTQLLRSYQEYGFQNDDAIIRMRKILSDTERMPNPPVGCVIAPVPLENEEDYQRLLQRVNAYSIAEHPRDWLFHLQQEQLFVVFGLWQDARMLGELVLSAYGAEGRIEMVYTRPDCRHRGIASALVAHAGQLLLRNGIRSLNAEVWRRVTPAMSMFGALRFESVSPIVLYPGMNI